VRHEARQQAITGNVWCMWVVGPSSQGGKISPKNTGFLEKNLVENLQSSIFVFFGFGGGGELCASSVIFVVIVVVVLK